MKKTILSHAKQESRGASFLLILLLLASSGTAAETFGRNYLKAMKRVDTNLAKIRSAEKDNAKLLQEMQKRLDYAKKAEQEKRPPGVSGATDLEQSLQAIQKNLDQLQEILTKLNQSTANARKQSQKLQDATRAAAKKAEQKKTEERQRQAREEARRKKERAMRASAADLERQLSREQKKMLDLKAALTDLMRVKSEKQKKNNERLRAAQKKAQKKIDALEKKLKKLKQEQEKKSQETEIELKKQEEDVTQQTQKKIQDLIKRFESEKKSLIAEGQKLVQKTREHYAALIATNNRTFDQNRTALEKKETRINDKLNKTKKELADDLNKITTKEMEIRQAISQQEAKLQLLKHNQPRYKIQDVVITGNRSAVHGLKNWEQLRAAATSTTLSDNEIEQFRQQLLDALRQAGYRQPKVELTPHSLTLGFLKFRVQAQP